MSNCLFSELKRGNSQSLRQYLREGELVCMYALRAVAIGGMTPLILYLGSSLGEWSALRPGRFASGDTLPGVE